MIKTLVQTLSEKLYKKQITWHEAARKLHSAGYTNFVDVEEAKKIINQYRNMEQ